MRCATLLVVLLSVTPCWANLSGPWRVGQLAIDVEGIKDVAIIREKLRIDLRALADGGRIAIHARYEIEYALAPRELSLTFITGAESVQSIRCLFNGQQLKLTTSQVINMPARWQPPRETPGFVPEEKLLYSRSVIDHGHEWINFSVPLQPGRHTIEVSYEVEAGAYYASKHTARYWQTAYILAPARNWKSFGVLDLEVLAPEGWQVKGNVPLANEGEKWLASFEAMPADFIALTTVHPDGNQVSLFDLSDQMWFFGLMLLFIGVRHAMRRYRIARFMVKDEPPCNHTSMILFLLSFIPLLWNLVATWFSSVPNSQSNYQLGVIFVYFQGIYWLIIIAVLMILSRLLLWLFCLLGSWLGRRASHHRAVPPPA